MKVEIWSDIVCPFCYIGKRKFELALAQFKGKEEVEIEYKSFQLDPNFKPIPGQSLAQYLALRKGVSEEEGAAMNAYVANVAKEVGLDYQLDKAIMNNTLDAHRLLHLAKKHGNQVALKEKLFAAYYTEGKDIGDFETLIELGKENGMEASLVSAMLESDEYKDAVHEDQYVAQQVGARGVPFFVFENKYGISGAQPVEVFAETLQKAATE